ncbi:MAG: VWA domain-containing protein [Atopobiaceae bacterium]|nr:VWA domain-containing protein [Atopobiaceae bacterium]
MPNINQVTTLSRRALHVFYVLDTSGSMRGLPIQRLNISMRESMNALQQVAYHNGDAQLKVAVLEFNSNWHWMQKDGPEDIDDFLWEDMIAAGLTNIGAALDELNARLSKDQFLRSSTGFLMPVIIFMTDGFATDNYEEALARIKQNHYFRDATRIGFAIGDNPDVAMISDLTGSNESVIRTDDLGLFANLLRFVSVGVSQRVSRSHGYQETSLAHDVLSDALNQANAYVDKSGMTVRVLDAESEPLKVEVVDGGHAWDDPE